MVTMREPYVSTTNNNIFQVCVKVDSKPDYVRLPEGLKEVYEEYGSESLESWHKKNGFFVE